MSRVRVVESPTDRLTRELEFALATLHQEQITQPSHDRAAFEAHIKSMSKAHRHLNGLLGKAAVRFASGGGGQPIELIQHCRVALSRTPGVKLELERKFSEDIQASRTNARLREAAKDIRHHFMTEAREVLEPEVFEALMTGARKRMADAGAQPPAQPQEEGPCPTSR